MGCALSKLKCSRLHTLLKIYSLYKQASSGDVPLMWYTNLPGAQKLQPNATGQFDLSLTDVPPFSSERWAPPVDAVPPMLNLFHCVG